VFFLCWKGINHNRPLSFPGIQGGGMRFTFDRAFADPDAAARQPLDIQMLK
jgi:hypothetical protein